MNNVGALLRKERLARQWSQKGLCEGICAVSYLSKIEQGKVTASENVLRPLFARLGLPWEVPDSELREAAELLRQMEEQLLLGDSNGLVKGIERLAEYQEILSRSQYAGKVELLRQFSQPESQPLPSALEVTLNERELALQRILQGRFTEALRMFPHAFVYCCAGMDAYERGDYGSAVALLEQAHGLAAEEAAVHLMFRCRVCLGNCYCNQLRLDQMRQEYARAERLGKLLGKTDVLAAISYNAATADLQTGNYEAAYGFFTALENPERLALHKLAICCEKLGRQEEAERAIARAMEAPCDWPKGELSLDICRIVAFRLAHPAYLQREEYGALLLNTFRTMRESLPVGYASFHLPWVLEWYTANRRYKEAYELMRYFPKINA